MQPYHGESDNGDKVIMAIFVVCVCVYAEVIVIAESVMDRFTLRETMEDVFPHLPV